MSDMHVSRMGWGERMLGGGRGREGGPGRERGDRDGPRDQGPSGGRGSFGDRLDNYRRQYDQAESDDDEGDDDDGFEDFDDPDGLLQGFDERPAPPRRAPAPRSPRAPLRRAPEPSEGGGDSGPSFSDQLDAMRAEKDAPGVR